MDEVEQKLGYPEVDPHGSPIPKKREKRALKLSEIGLNQIATIDEKQANEQISTALWKLGLMPTSKIFILSFKNEQMKIKQQGKVIDVRMNLAEQVSVTRYNE